MDSLLIITCSGNCEPLIAKEIKDEEYCSTKSMYYHGLKLHTLAFHRSDHLPIPGGIGITPAFEYDLNVHKQNWSDIPNRSFYDVKINQDAEMLKIMTSQGNFRVMPPFKTVQSQLEITCQLGKAANDLYSYSKSVKGATYQGVACSCIWQNRGSFYFLKF